MRSGERWHGSRREIEGAGVRADVRSRGREIEGARRLLKLGLELLGLLQLGLLLVPGLLQGVLLLGLLLLGILLGFPMGLLLLLGPPLGPLQARASTR